MPAPESDLASRDSMVAGLLLGGGQQLGIESAQLVDRCLILPDSGTLGRGEPRHGVPPVGLVLEQHEIVGLVLVHPDDPGHRGVIEPAGPGQGRLQQAELSGDLVVMCRSRSQAEAALARLTDLLASLGLEPKAAKDPHRSPGGGRRGF
jgi:hypothetical protein